MIGWMIGILVCALALALPDSGRAQQVAIQPSQDIDMPTDGNRGWLSLAHVWKPGVIRSALRHAEMRASRYPSPLAMPLLSLDPAPTAYLCASTVRQLVFPSALEAGDMARHAALMVGLHRLGGALLRLAHVSRNRDEDDDGPRAQVEPLLSFTRFGANVRGWF